MLLMNVTGSRGPFVALILSAILLGFFTIKYSFKTKLVLFVVFGFIGLEFLSFFFSNIVNRFSALSTDYSSIIRIYAIYNGVIYFLQKPVFGWGTGSFSTLVSEYIKYPHNIFIELAMEIGIVGVIIFILFLSFAIYNFFYLRKKVKNISQSILLRLNYFFFLFGFFNSQFSGDIANNPIMWFSVGNILILRYTILQWRKN
jgi:O-antigen ligase